MFKYITSATLFLITIFISSFVASLISNTAFAALTCSNVKKECLEAGGTRYFEGVAVRLDCWRYKNIYECREKADNNCQHLREQGCSQVSAKCRTFAAGTCVVQDEIFKCPVEQCDKKGDIVCAKNVFCVGGDCSPTTSMKNNNFDRAASSLAVLATAAEEVKQQNDRDPQIFTGRSMECSVNILPGLTKDCCAGNEGILGSCDAEEKELLQMRRDGRAIEVGEYCYNEVLGKCTSHHRAYCVFGSKMARIVQNDGRKNQLGIGFGSVGSDYAHLNCRGVTKEELAKMNFNKMDFSPLYSDIRRKMAEKMPSNEMMGKKATTSSLDDLKRKSMEGISKPEFRAEQKVLDRMKSFYERNKK